MNKNITTEDNMKKEYDLSKLSKRKNPYSKNLKKQVTIRLGVDAIDYFKHLSGDSGVPYQNLINSYLMDCAMNKKKLKMEWK